MIGVLEYWSGGVMGSEAQYFITPPLQFVHVPSVPFGQPIKEIEEVR
jgi:hypothetical protein